MKLQNKLSVFFLLAGILLLSTVSMAQKNIEQVKEIPKAKLHITKELEAQIIEVVKPVKEKIEKLLNDDGSGTYALYKDDIKKLIDTKGENERSAMLQKIQKKYYPFIKKIWDQAKIDDNQYKLKLTSLFPPDLRETIRFGEFLNFTMGSSHQKPTPPPPPPPSPSNVCVDANALFRGSFGLDGGAIGSSEVIVAPANSPSPAEIVVSVGTGIIGSYRGQGWIRNTITIPANIPSNYKVLRSTKTFDWTGMADAASILGCCWSTVAYSTSPDDPNFNICGETYTAVAPVIFVCFITKRTSKTEEAIFTKNDTRGTQFGITCYGTASSSLYFSYAHAHSSCAMIKWGVCEE
jgi:hypothetical protein